MIRRPLACAFVHTPDSFYADTQNYGVQFMPVWAYTLASHLNRPESYKLSLYDTRRDSLSSIARADVFLFSGINQDYGYLTEIHKTLKTKYPDSLFIIGGPICWSFHKAGDLAKLSLFDHIFIGDGEEMLPDFFQKLFRGEPSPKIIETKERFPILQARPFHRPFLDPTIHRYYGAVLEVSRGCPFLCEFCDIRILPDNNRPHNKNPELIVSEINHLCELGVKQVLLACDNFIGDVRWAETVVDALIAWEEKSGFHPSLYTWLTINLYRHDALMRKMRKAGFDMLFIGVESFYQNSLLETAKIQNVKLPDMAEVIKTVQSYGFIVVAGLIFGFDSDPPNIFELTAEGLLKSGLISGDPSLLTALPGTPLYRRMQMSGRLRQVRYGLGGYKYQTNIKYLIPKKELTGGYKRFVTMTTKGRYQYERLKKLCDCFESGNYVPLKSQGYGSPLRFAKMILRNPIALKQFAERMFRTMRSPDRVFYILAGFGLTLVRSLRRRENLYRYFQFWFFVWSNSMLKYADLKDSDFDVDSVGEGFKMVDVLPDNYEASADEEIQKDKIDAQLRLTTAQLKNLVLERQVPSSPSGLRPSEESVFHLTQKP